MQCRDELDNRKFSKLTGIMVKLGLLRPLRTAISDLERKA